MASAQTGTASVVVNISSMAGVTGVGSIEHEQETTTQSLL
jgi:hypothetical protein